MRHFWHVGINVTNLDNSIAFYRHVGFEVVQDKEVRDTNLEKAFMVDGGRRLRFAHMRLSDAPGEAMLDLIEWLEPRSSGQATADLLHPGLCRFSILTDDIEAEYRRLTDVGIEFLNTPQTVLGPDGTSGWRLLFARDPDGTLFHFVELVVSGSTS